MIRFAGPRSGIEAVTLTFLPGTNLAANLLEAERVATALGHAVLVIHNDKTHRVHPRNPVAGERRRGWVAPRSGGYSAVVR